MKKSVLIIGNGFDQDLGINLSFKEWRKSHYCYSQEYSRVQPKGDLWNDFEKTLRETILSVDEESCTSEDITKDLNLYWYGFWKYISVFFSEVTKDFPDNKSVVENCAFEILKKLNELSCVYTFNYTYPYEYTNLPQKCEFNFVHGRYFKDYFVGMQAMMIQSPNMIIGIDSKRIPSYIKENKLLGSIIKKQNSQFKESHIENALSETENVIFFGHSLGITDSDYFDEFFYNLGTNKCKRIYFVTYNQDSFNDIKNASAEWGVDWEELNSKNIEIIPIFTSEGINQSKFQELLSLI